MSAFEASFLVAVELLLQTSVAFEAIVSCIQGKVLNIWRAAITVRWKHAVAYSSFAVL